MAVPKKRTTSGKQGSRRSHHGLSADNLMVTKDGGLMHRRLVKAVKLGLIKK